MVGPPESTSPAERARPWSGEGIAERGDRLCRSAGGLHSCGLSRGATWTRPKKGGGGAECRKRRRRKNPRRRAVGIVDISGPRGLTRGWSVADRSAPAGPRYPSDGGQGGEPAGLSTLSTGATIPTARQRAHRLAPVGPVRPRVTASAPTRGRRVRWSYPCSRSRDSSTAGARCSATNRPPTG